MKTDEELIIELQKGDDKAFELLLKRHKDSVFNFIYRFVGNHSEAEDLLQDVFLKIFDKAQDYKPLGKFKTWLYTMARNQCVDHYRRKQIRKAESLNKNIDSDSEQTFLDQLASENVDTETSLKQRELDSILEAALQSLSEEQREVVLLRSKMGFKFDEIAEMTNNSSNTVKSRMRYALEGIRKYFKQSGYGEYLD